MCVFLREKFSFFFSIQMSAELKPNHRPHSLYNCFFEMNRFNIISKKIKITVYCSARWFKVKWYLV